MRYPTFIFILMSFSTWGQTTNGNLADSLRYVKDMPYICETGDGFGCGDRIFWRVVQQKEKVIPVLIDLLVDTTTTSATVPNFGGQWTVADIAFTGLQEIIKDIPTFDLLGVEFDNNGCGYCVYWNHLRRDIRNRRKFQAKMREWYDRNKVNLVWVRSNEFMSCDCRGEHPNGGHFELRGE